MPPGRVIHVPGRGELFLRDSGGDGPPILLLHGWMFSADLNWYRAYGPLREAGYRVLAVDHRGHGRGLRTHADFRLADCADDAAALLETLGVAPVIAVGYSMGGAIASLLARDHPHRVAGLVLSATAREWQDPRTRRLWRGLAAIRLTLGLFPQGAWRTGFRLAGYPDSAITTWQTAELTRGSAADISEAGYELSRFDSRPWIESLDVPAAVVVTARDTSVPPRKQRDLATALRAQRIEVDADHVAVTARADEWNAALLDGLERMGLARGRRAAAA
jgi:3-oxoadipate enol-lactonase